MGRGCFCPVYDCRAGLSGAQKGQRAMRMPCRNPVKASTGYRPPLPDLSCTSSTGPEERNLRSQILLCLSLIAPAPKGDVHGLQQSQTAAAWCSSSAQCDQGNMVLVVSGVERKSGEEEWRGGAGSAVAESQPTRNDPVYCTLGTAVAEQLAQCKASRYS